jgi:hypothetical protein
VFPLSSPNFQFQRNGTIILETTTCDGKEMPGSAGRLMLPGIDIKAEY